MYRDDISWAAGWLYLATGEEPYLTENSKYTQVKTTGHRIIAMQILSWVQPSSTLKSLETGFCNQLHRTESQRKPESVLCDEQLGQCKI